MFVCFYFSSLIKLGYEVDTAVNGNQAIRLYKEAMQNNRSYSGVIFDLTVRGGMGGKTAINKLKKIDPNIRAIVSSGYSNDPILANPRKFGFLDVIHKPYIIEKVSEILHNTLHSA